MSHKTIYFGGQAAFPIPGENYGLTIRQYYAGLAMQGLCANSELLNVLSAQGKAGAEQEKIISEIAVSQADTLIAALEEKEGKA